MLAGNFLISVNIKSEIILKPKHFCSSLEKLVEYRVSNDQILTHRHTSNFLLFFVILILIYYSVDVSVF